MTNDLFDHYVLTSSTEEVCAICGEQAAHKVKEDISDSIRHPYTNYLCCHCFGILMGPAARQTCIETTPLPEFLLQQQVEQMREALEDLEWINEDGQDNFCPWCLRREPKGHRDDCIRQAALAAVDAVAEGESDTGG